MTKKELKWRLSELPTGGEIADLVEQGIINKEEARSILFNAEDKKTTKKVKELEEEVKFLRELCDKLAAKTSGGWTTIVHKYRHYKPLYPTWYGTYGSIMNTGTSQINYSSTSGAINVGAVGATTTKSLSSLN